ncbi:hypothetical protein [Pelagicoccus mobilis]|uniref:HD domain-containing protein n=1 Tax=Pelagicoccus mobilis TaxID=415221 RepID=A0A934RY96_9BACT|nr:hypothetical protein [Pelagicoccus mobilis]MBK1877051.1 hypothetical protein [Pelagicoccus mobilis]
MPTTALSNDELAKRAESIARTAHAGQFRRDGATPYIVHPQAVSERVEGAEAKAAAWLHDVLEDTSWTEEQLLDAGIPQHVVEAVTILTKNPGITYQDYLEKVNNNPLSRTVKIADMLANLSDNPSRKQILKYAKGLLFLHGESENK